MLLGGVEDRGVDGHVVLWVTVMECVPCSCHQGLPCCRHVLVVSQPDELRWGQDDGEDSVVIETADTV